MYPSAMWFWPYTLYAMWLNAVMAPWTVMAQKGELPPAAAAVPMINPVAAVGLDPVSSEDIGTSATDLRPKGKGKK